MKTNGSDNIIIQTKNGYYYGTSKGDSWWRRYTKDGWMMRGNSKVYVDRSGIHFQRYMTKEVKHIYHKDIVGLKIGKGHAGKWMGFPVLKVAWKLGGKVLVSGFTIATDKEGTRQWIDEIEKARGSAGKTDFR